MSRWKHGADGELRVIFAGGGTGGHLMPGAAVAEALRAMMPGTRCMFLGTNRRAEAHCNSAISRFEWREVPAARWGRSLQKLRFAAVSAVAAGKCLSLMREFRPQALVGLGGYSCVAPLLAARLAGVRTMVFESNAVPGRVVRLLAPHVDCVQLQWDRAASRLKARRVMRSGNPVRTCAMVSDKDKALRRLGLERGRVTLLVTGGSQGALSLNRTVLEALGVMAGPGGPVRPEQLQVLHLTGVQHLAEACAAALPAGLLYCPRGFLGRMGDAYSAADFVVSRAGGATLAELTAAGLPSVLVPYPHAADGHQQANADVLVEAGAAVCIPESELTAQVLASTLAEFVNRPERRAAIAANSATLGRPEAATNVAIELVRMVGLPLRRADLAEGLKTNESSRVSRAA